MRGGLFGMGPAFQDEFTAQKSPAKCRLLPGDWMRVVMPGVRVAVLAVRAIFAESSTKFSWL